MGTKNITLPENCIPEPHTHTLTSCLCLFTLMNHHTVTYQK